mmetsp:Transcript_3906/g.14502  ORF Transcript_3906/g.14502 Transcript_3906/m.14502 type:complete len:263 (+) Transcript_3906:406-1194(+)
MRRRRRRIHAECREKQRQLVAREGRRRTDISARRDVPTLGCGRDGAGALRGGARDGAIAHVRGDERRQQRSSARSARHLEACLVNDHRKLAIVVVSVVAVTVVAHVDVLRLGGARRRTRPPRKPHHALARGRVVGRRLVGERVVRTTHGVHLCCERVRRRADEHDRRQVDPRCRARCGREGVERNAQLRTRLVECSARRDVLLCHRQAHRARHGRAEHRVADAKWDDAHGEVQPRRGIALARLRRRLPVRRVRDEGEAGADA